MNEQNEQKPFQKPQEPLRNVNNDFMELIENVKAGEPIFERILRVQNLSPDSDYSYCPRCAKKLRRIYGDAWKSSMPTLQQQTFKCLLKIGESTGRVVFDTRYFCKKCKQYITVEDFIDVYCEKKCNKDINQDIDLTKVDLKDPYYRRFF